MITKKFIRLINNERMKRNVVSAKAYAECDATSEDVCAIIDNAACTIYSEDYCVKDYAGCTNHSFDYCGGEGGRDYGMCYEGNVDAA